MRRISSCRPTGSRSCSSSATTRRRRTSRRSSRRSSSRGRRRRSTSRSATRRRTSTTPRRPRTSRYRSSAGTATPRRTSRPVPLDYLKKWATFVTTTTNLLDPNTNAPKYNKYGAIMQQVFYHKYGLKTNIGGGIGWDNVAGIVWSLKKAGGPDPKKMIAAFESTAKAGGRRPVHPGRSHVPLLEHAALRLPAVADRARASVRQPAVAGLLLRRVLVQNDAAFLVNGRPLGGGRFFCCACK